MKTLNKLFALCSYPVVNELVKAGNSRPECCGEKMKMVIAHPETFWLPADYLYQCDKCKTVRNVGKSNKGISLREWWHFVMHQSEAMR